MKLLVPAVLAALVVLSVVPPAVARPGASNATDCLGCPPPGALPTPDPRSTTTYTYNAHDFAPLPALQCERRSRDRVNVDEDKGKVT